MGILNLPAGQQAHVIAEINDWLKSQPAPTRAAWALGHLPGPHVVSSSFGVQSAVMLHMLTQVKPDIPVLLADTGYLFPETYRYVDELAGRLSLNLYVSRADMSPAWQETKFGQLWDQGPEGLKKYNAMNKVEPMAKALDNLEAKTWFTGLRRVQAETRSDIPFAEVKDGRVKVHPLADWSNKAVYKYMKAHDLPQHPLWEEGYVSVGDTHSTQKLQPGMREEDTRFGGQGRECGLHT